MKTIKYAVVGFALAAAGSAQAAGVGVRVGTTGLGADVAWSLAPTLSARLGYSGGNVNYNTSTSAVSYDGKVKISAGNALLDFSPLGPFRITGGLMFSGTKYDAVGNAGNGNTVNATVKPGKSTAPYLGIGYGNVSGTGVNFYADLGVIFQGTPKASVSVSCATPGSPSCTSLQNSAAAEQARIEDKLKDFKYYPVLNIGLTIGF
jgi:hypothetical protein